MSERIACPARSNPSERVPLFGVGFEMLSKASLVLRRASYGATPSLANMLPFICSFAPGSSQLPVWGNPSTKHAFESSARAVGSGAAARRW